LKRDRGKLKNIMEKDDSMKYVFGVNITDDKDNLTVDGQVFVGKTLPTEMSESIEKCLENSESLQNKAELPIWIRIIKLLTGFLSCFLVVGVANGLMDVPIRQAYENAPYLFYLIAISAFIWIVLHFLSKSKIKNVENSDEFIRNVNYAKEVLSNAWEVFDIPTDAKEVDILTFFYKFKKGKMKTVNVKGYQTYVNFVSKVYVKEGALYIVDIEQEWVIPLDCIKGIKKINKRINVPDWNKEIPYNKGEYKKYNITSNNIGFILFKPYYALSIESQKEEYELFIPPYEKDVICSLIEER